MSYSYSKYIDGVKSGCFGTSPNIVVVDPDGYGDYTDMYSALDSITDASSTNIYCIIGCGDIEDTNIIQWKSYVNLIGFGLNWNINTDTNGSGVLFNNLTDVRLVNVKIRRNGNVTVSSHVTEVSGTTDDTVIFENVHFINEITSSVERCFSVLVTDTSSPRFENCSMVGSSGDARGCGLCVEDSSSTHVIGCTIRAGSGGDRSYGISLTSSGDSIFSNCDVFGGTGGTDCFALQVGTTKNGVAGSINNCRISGIDVGISFEGVLTTKISGCTICSKSGIYVFGIACPTITGCSIIYEYYGLYMTENSGAVVSDCLFKYKDVSAYHYFTGLNDTMLPLTGNPYFIYSMRIYVSVAGAPGSTLDIGTTPGGNEIISGVPTDVTGYLHLGDINMVNILSDSPIYLTFSDTNSRVKFYYVAGYNNTSYSVRINNNNYTLFSNCSFYSNLASAAGYVMTPALTAGKIHFVGCLFNSIGSYAIFGQTPGTISTNNCTYIGGIYNITPQDWSFRLSGSVMNISDIIGSPRLLVPCVEPTGTSIADYTRLANTLTAQSSVATWRGDHGEACFYDFNGTAHYLYRANDTDFDFGNAATDDAFSIVCCVNPDDVTSRQIIGKWDDNNQREWRLFFDATGYPTFQLYDESADTYIGRQDQTVFTTGSWQVIVATYDGSGINAGCKIYIDGVQLDDADYDNGVYVAMEAVTANLMVGALKDAAVYSEYYDGKMTWIGVAAKELSADEVWSLTQRLKGVLGI